MNNVLMDRTCKRISYRSVIERHVHGVEVL